MPPPYLLNYVLIGLETSPRTLKALIGVLDDSSPMWDSRPDPDRFTLREAIAHLADWEPIWLERLQRICNEETPVLKSIDEGELALTNDYANTSPSESLERFAGGRESVVTFLRSRPPTDWDRVGDREGAGLMSMFEIAAMILGHDGYHAAQALDCLRQ